MIVCLLCPVSAAAAPDVVGADSVAMGSTSLAAHDSNAAITTNPGLLALEDRYDFSAQAGIGPGLHWAATGMDGRTAENFALGFSYSGDRYEPDLTIDELPGWAEPNAEIPNMKRSHDLALAGAGSIADDRVSFGLGGHVSLYNHDRNGQGTTGNVDAGIGLKPTDFLTVGLAGHNLVPLDVLGDRPTRFGGGVRLHGTPGALEVDAGWEDTDTGSPLFLDAGAEARPGAARLRAGGRWHGPTGVPSVTGGFGFEGEGGALEYGIEVPLGPDGGPIAHVVGVRFGAPAPIPVPD
jgi:hypothetical protein